ncbi:hypothetical protein IEO21_10723 [Rhodonia placenta]|uniref:Uncharacterized protein n=1 Tax=Rhodonia placenta TaxID=104341 RepID=A0A8H7NS76_9APHY|nr:hypothetical protein IEO21_10723 [Postia placenta]
MSSRSATPASTPSLVNRRLSALLVVLEAPPTADTTLDVVEDGRKICRRSSSPIARPWAPSATRRRSCAWPPPSNSSPSGRRGRGSSGRAVTGPSSRPPSTLRSNDAPKRRSASPRRKHDASKRLRSVRRPPRTVASKTNVVERTKRTIAGKPKTSVAHKRPPTRSWRGSRPPRDSSLTPLLPVSTRGKDTRGSTTRSPRCRMTLRSRLHGRSNVRSR